MKLTIVTTTLVAASLIAAVPNTFSAGRSVVAHEVNDNFTYLDTTVAKKADQATVTTLQTTVSGLQTSKADASALSTKADASLKDSLKARVDTGSFSQFKAKEASDVATLNTAIKGSLTADGLKGIRDTLSKKANTVIADSLGKQISELSATKADATALANAVNSMATKDAWNSQPSSLVSNDSYWFHDARAGDLIVRNGVPTATVRLGIDDGTGSNQSSIWYNKDAAGVNVPFTLGSTMFGTSLELSRSLNTQYTTIEGNLNPAINSVPGKDGALIGWNRQSGRRRFDFVSQQLSDLGAGGFDWWMVLDQTWKRIMALDPQGNLRLAGDISVKADLASIPDYVFEPDYKLTALSEVEAYTKEHKHLPEVPSATEIEKGGLDLAQMNLVLLKKVEELTLHAIKQQKEITELRASVDDLKKH